jgi:hypothetical protein
MAKETDIVKKDETALALTDEMLTGPIGGEALSSTDMTIPYVELVQSLSWCATRQTGVKIETGHWHNALTDEDYGKEISVVVLDAIPGFQLKDAETGKKIIATRWKSEKVRGYNAEMITDDMIGSRVFKKGEAQLLGDAFCYQVVVAGKDLALITFKGAACKAARGLNTMLMTRTMIKDGKTYHVPFYAQQFKFGAKWIDKGDKKYWEPAITPDGNTRPQLLQALCEMAKDLSSKTVATGEPAAVEGDKEAF